MSACARFATPSLSYRRDTYVLAVEWLMNMACAISGTVSPLLSRPSTSASRELSDSAAWASRRRASALARPEAVNDPAATAEWRIAATTSSIGANFATNAEAPVSSARNSRSSSPREVSMTIPR